MKRVAIIIYNKHLWIGAKDAVNVDSNARLAVEKGLKNPTPKLFSLAEKQVQSIPFIVNSVIVNTCL